MNGQHLSVVHLLGASHQPYIFCALSQIDPMSDRLLSANFHSGTLFYAFAHGACSARTTIALCAISHSNQISFQHTVYASVFQSHIGRSQRLANPFSITFRDISKRVAQKVRWRRSIDAMTHPITSFVRLLHFRSAFGKGKEKMSANGNW